jgi:hypothetical protein
MIQFGRRLCMSGADGTVNALMNIAERVTWLVLVPVVVLAAWVWTGPAWALWAVGAVAVLSARRELSRLCFRPWRSCRPGGN